MALAGAVGRGLRVIGIDRFMIPGPFSAYAGESRVFRMVYAEGGHYTPLLQRARDLWHELEAASGDLIADGTTATDIGFMNPGRFLPPGGAVDTLQLRSAHD